MTNEWNQEFQEKRISRNDEQTTTKKSQRKNEGTVERFIEASETGLQTCSHYYYYYKFNLLHLFLCFIFRVP